MSYFNKINTEYYVTIWTKIKLLFVPMELVTDEDENYIIKTYFKVKKGIVYLYDVKLIVKG